MDAVGTVIEAQGASGTYPVVIAPGALSHALPRFVEQHGFTRAIVISNDTVGPLYAEALVRRLPHAGLVTVPDGEQHKTLDTVRGLYSKLLAHGADRSTLIVALGGGVVGDMGGFAAATFMRGVPLVQAPTSLLAMVDASIGGKVGVDLPEGKNLVGAFKDPLAVFVDLDALRTLPAVEFRCGMAEVIKAGLIDDPLLLAELSEGARDVPDSIERAIRVKAGVVAQDRLERGVRAYLNLGHTFAHAIEQVSGYAWRHGEAVAVGLVAAARLSAQRQLCDPALAERVERGMRQLDLPVRMGDLDPGVLWDAMRHDKKWRDGAARFVLLADVGQPVLCDDVPRDEVIAVLESLRGAS